VAPLKNLGMKVSVFEVALDYSSSPAATDSEDNYYGWRASLPGSPNFMSKLSE